MIGKLWLALAGKAIKRALRDQVFKLIDSVTAGDVETFKVTLKHLVDHALGI
jgi:hypothetical protein